MVQDPYTVLGVGRDASTEEIRKAFRALAKRFHPDRNPGDASAEDKFKAASAAFEIVGDPTQRARFDRGEIDAAGNERASASPFSGGAHRWQSRGGAQPGGHGPGGGFEDISDIFGDFFGGRGAGGSQRQRAQKGKDIRYRLGVDFLDAARGATKRVALADGRHVDVAIPEGLKDGQTLRLKGQGAEGIGGGPRGDVFVDVSVRPHPFFSADGDDLILDVPITLKEAVLGARIEIPTLGGTVAIKVPPNTSSGTTFRLRGKGLKQQNADRHGDLLAKARIVLPQGGDESLRSLIDEWDAPQEAPRAQFRTL